MRNLWRMISWDLARVLLLIRGCWEAKKNHLPDENPLTHPGADYWADT